MPRAGDGSDRFELDVIDVREAYVGGGVGGLVRRHMRVID